MRHILRTLAAVVIVSLLTALSATESLAQVVCEGYGAVGTQVHDTNGEVNTDMSDGEVSNVTIDIDDFEDDMVNVPSGTKVTFDQVTFAGNGTGHLLEIKNNSQADVTRSAFIGHASEDDIQLEQHKFTRIGFPDDPESGNCFDSDAAEDHIDIKATTNTSRNVGINNNVFLGSQWCVLANNGQKTVHFRDNECAGGAYLRGGVHDGVVSDNFFDDVVWIDEINDYLLQNNTFNGVVRYGGGSGGATTTPERNFFRDNTFNSINNWNFVNQGNDPCLRNNNDIRLDECDFQAV